jgi:beta-mannosidase
MTRSVELTAGWSLRAINGDEADRVPASVPAQVPGCVHTDLMAAGVIEDPYLDANEDSLRWLYDLDWRYATALDPAELPLDRPGEAERVDLVLEGIDTVGTVRLREGQREIELGHTCNMHRSYRFDVSPHLTGGPLDLEVDLSSASRYAEAEDQRLGERPRAYPPPFNMIRKMASSFGWDWGPDLRTAGLWKPVRVERWRLARLAQVVPLVTLGADGTGRVELRVELERAAPTEELVLAAEILGQRAEARVDDGASTATVVLDVPDAPVWWPAGYGDQPLADLELSLRAGEEVLDGWRRRIGFRSVALDTSADQYGAGFTFVINGRRVFAKGVNWIPDDHFLTRITAERLERRLDQAVAANVNLVRVWGGGIFESEDFYHACDERGLMVWQDFLLACAAYPEEPPLWAEIDAEARENVVRLAAHPSLVLYNGGNENLWGHEDWHWKERLQGRTWGARYALELFPAIVAELDPTRPYSVNSPCSPGFDLDQVHPNDPNVGSHHQWDVWNAVDYTAYRDEIPRFVSEFGFQGPPAWRTLTDWVHAADGGPLAAAPEPKADPNFLVHQKAQDGNGKLDRGMAPHLGVPNDFTDWHWAGQLNQARAVAYAIDHYRRWWPRTAGAVVWQLNDCWPVTSWAAVDFAERPKPLWYALRRAFAPRNLAFVVEDEALSLALLNDADEPWQGELSLSRQRLDGSPLADQTMQVSIEPRASTVIAVPAEVARPANRTAEVVVARLDAVSRAHTFVEDVELAWNPDPLEVEVSEHDEGYDVRLTAHSFVRDVTVLADRIAADAMADDALLTLPAGQSATIRVRTNARGLTDELGRYPVLRTANDLQSARQRS